MKYFVILGSGGHALSSYSLIRCVYPDAEIISISDDYMKPSKLPSDVEVVGPISNISKLFKKSSVIINGIGGIWPIKERALLFERIRSQGFEFKTIVHKNAALDCGVQIGEGVQIHSGSTIRIGAVVEDNVIINTGVIIDHGSRIGRNSIIAPGVVIAGNVNIAEGSFIGAGTTIIQNIDIGHDVFVAAGSLVLHSIKPKLRISGAPAKPMKE